MGLKQEFFERRVCSWSNILVPNVTYLIPFYSSQRIILCFLLHVLAAGAIFIQQLFKQPWMKEAKKGQQGQDTIISLPSILENQL